MKTAIIKTGFWQDDEVFELNSDTRLLYLCLLTNPQRDLLPAFRVSDRMLSAYTGYSRDLIDICRRQLIDSGRILYQEGYYIFTKQDYVKPSAGRDTIKIYEREYDKLPASVRQIIENNTLVESTGTSTGTTTSSGTGYNNNNKNIHNNINEEKEQTKENTNDDITKVYNTFIELFKRNPVQYKLTPARTAKIKSRLKDAGLDMLLLAIEKTSKSPFHTGFNDRKWKADLDFIIRTYENTEKLSNLEIGGQLKYDVNKPKPKNIPKPVEDRRVEMSPEEAEKNRIVIELVRNKKATFGEMKSLRNKSIEELRSML